MDDNTCTAIIQTSFNAPQYMFTHIRFRINEFSVPRIYANFIILCTPFMQT